MEENVTDKSTVSSFTKKVNDFSRDRKIMKSEISMTKYKEHWYKMVSQKIKDRDVIESNSLIARFMGYEIDDKNEFFHGIHYYYMTEKNMSYSECTIENVRSCTEGFVWNYSDFTERRYDNSWDYLIPVCKKMCETNEFLNSTIGQLMIDCNFDIETVWKSIVNYLKKHYPLKSN